MERACKGRVSLVCYERGKSAYPGLSPEETCLRLVRDCDALIVLIDQYYGRLCNRHPEISITHAEVREALNLGLTVVPVVRTQTWHEYFVWRVNSGRALTFAHVRESRVFEILEELYSRFNCHVYDNLTGDEAMSEIANTLDAIITFGSTGAIEHVALPAEVSEARDVAPTSWATGLPWFLAGQVLRSDDLNLLYRSLVDRAAKHGLHMQAAVTWKSGHGLTASQLNALLDDVERVYKHIGRQSPEWSFGRFQDGKVLCAWQLNEVVDSLQGL
jgi:hypothetical protein